MLASLVSFLHFNAGDLTEEHTKKMPDKKAFIRLFTQARHNKIQSPAEDPLNKFIPRQAVFTGPEADFEGKSKTIGYRPRRCADSFK